MATNNTNGAQDVLDKIAGFSDQYRGVAERLHAIIMQADPSLVPRLWYGMPGYAKSENSAVLLFFREDKFVSFGLTENAVARVAPNELLVSAWFLTDIDKTTEQKIHQIVSEVLS